MKNKFYITTSIPYINAEPHLGHAMEFVEADIVARYKRAAGFDVWFQIGTDDNSLKNVQAAEKAGMSVTKHVDKYSQEFRELATTLNISSDDFIRTTEERHFIGVEKLWNAASDDFYKKKYKGLYCVGCEEFKREGDMVDGKCPEHPNAEPQIVEEENYFFRLSKYQKELENIIATDEYLVIPEKRKNEVLAFIKQGLEDFSISRSKERAKGWGVPVPGDPDQVIYVWFDALANYITALGYGMGEKKFERYWPCDLHIIGKGIMKFHAIYWPAMLLAAKIKLPKKLFIHGYITIDGEKMSKSLGNVINPNDLVKKYGVDGTRYLLTRLVPAYGDGDLTWDRLDRAYQADLANDLGNLVQRTISMINKYKLKYEFKEVACSGDSCVGQLLESQKFDKALEKLWQCVRAQNKLIDNEKPWELAKNDPKKLEEVLGRIYYFLCTFSTQIYPFMPDFSKELKSQLSSLKPKPLFPKLEEGKVS